MPQNKILILFAHPLFEKSFVNQELVRHIPFSNHITFHDLYEEYPEFDINVKHEQNLLEKHDIIIWHHPMYWYSCPPLLKQWIDMVLEYDWAYGKNGNALNGKSIFQVITTGGAKENYCATGKDRFSIPELLEPFNQTAKVCKMNYLPPFVVHGTHKMNEEEVFNHAKTYAELLLFLTKNEINSEEINRNFYMNEWFLKIKSNG
ncbi:MAG TPA: NAD(P)H-dependent oxidoreductase [Flavobacterium sp.]|uniref:glutathione-regulated potassium-efflux system oxidoreductase KefF n=1 Tax=unclassified Flavobacterium TaxID=196869 RepID=UPI000E89276F|nr:MULTISPECIES: NAD(P)H-dependent oxidoreductase [unclassified Flavobacterium]HBI01853.1 NAD(P)H oxidoreductase [Flavobacterium sp.]HRE78959.1 NAD(P)H-dependent oxidoreductase [Flavobacterium sp.]